MTAHYDVLIVGGGFGGTAAARQLEKRFRGRAERVLLVAQENFFTFTPLLPEAASGTLEPRHSVLPLRQLLPRTDVIVGEVTKLDVTGRRAVVVDLNGESHDITFRAVVVAPGSVPTTFPIPGLLEHAVGFKTLADAIWLRNRVLRQLEAADATDDLDERRAMLTFTFVGGGYAGVEALAELESLAHDAVRTYDRLSMRDMRWVLVEAADGLLPGLDRRLARYSERQLRRRGIEVHLSTRMESCVDSVVTLSDSSVDPFRSGTETRVDRAAPASHANVAPFRSGTETRVDGAEPVSHAKVAPFRSGTIVWTAGQRPSPLGRLLGLPLNERGRIVVDDHLRVPGIDGVFAVGDAAAVPAPDGGVCPLTAQHALRQGRVCGSNVAASLGAGAPERFAYRTRGLAVTLGKHQGTAQVRRFVFTGWIAWWMGRSYHLLMLPGWARRARIVSDWTLALFFPRDVSQLGALGQPTPLEPPTRLTLSRSVKVFWRIRTEDLHRTPSGWGLRSSGCVRQHEVQ